MCNARAREERKDREAHSGVRPRVRIVINESAPARARARENLSRYMVIYRIVRNRVREIIISRRTFRRA